MERPSRASVRPGFSAMLLGLQLLCWGPWVVVLAGAVLCSHWICEGQAEVNPCTEDFPAFQLTTQTPPSWPSSLTALLALSASDPWQEALDGVALENMSLAGPRGHPSPAGPFPLAPLSGPLAALRLCPGLKWTLGASDLLPMVLA